MIPTSRLRAGGGGLVTVAADDRTRRGSSVGGEVDRSVWLSNNLPYIILSQGLGRYHVVQQMKRIEQLELVLVLGADAMK